MKKPALTTVLQLFSVLICSSQTAQPTQSAILTTLVSPHPGGSITIRVSNEHYPGDLKNIWLEWELLVNGYPKNKGKITELLITPQRSSQYRLPVRMVTGSKDEIFLNVRYRLKKKPALSPAADLVDCVQLSLRGPYGNDCTVRPNGALTFTDENGLFDIGSPVCRLQFNKQTGRLQCYIVRDMALLDTIDGVLPWDILTDTPKLQLFSTSTASDMAIVSADYTLQETLGQLHVRYTINALGELGVEHSLVIDSAQNAPLPSRYGMQWLLPPGFDSIIYYGLRSGDDHPAENCGLAAGIYRQPINVQTAVRWYRVTDKAGYGMLISADSSLLTIDARSLPQARLQIDYMIPASTSAANNGSYHYLYKISPVYPAVVTYIQPIQKPGHSSHLRKINDGIPTRISPRGSQRP